MARVYEAFDEERGHRVALKTLKHASPEAVYRLKREFRVVADIPHPNLVQLYDLVVGNRGTSYSMEVVDGVDFATFVRGRGRATSSFDDTLQSEATLPDAGHVANDGQPRAIFDEERLRAALSQLVAALGVLHDAGLVHRDVKPSNALVTAEGRLVVLDFGLAASRQSLDEGSLHGLVGTVAYMSPEQAAEVAELRPSSDWYAVGVMLYEALTGRLPHVGTFFDVLTAKRTRLPPRPGSVVAGVPPDLDALCMRLLAIDPERRPKHDEIAAALGMAAGERTNGRLELTLAPRFTGRAAELAALDRALEVVRDGRAAMTWIRGASGIGKTTLIAESLARIQARHPDAVILRGRCYEQELVPFKAIDGLIDGLSRVWRRMPDPDAAAILPRAAAALQRLFPVLARVPVVAEAPPFGESRDPIEIRARAFAALRELLQRLADRRLVVMFLDDLQWVDGDTLHLLDDLFRPPEAPRILLVASSRADVPTPGLADAIARMDVELTKIELGPLPAHEARTLVAGMLGDATAEVADRVVREAAGSPFFLGELVRYLQTVGEGTTEVHINDVVRRRISLLPPSARGLLEIVAIAREPLLLRELAAAAGLDAEQAARDLRVLRVDHLVRAPGGRGDERVEPYHDRIRAAILDLLGTEARRQRHRALAVALGGDASPARLARHWAAAGDRARAALYARRAADNATAAFDFETACDLYQMALDHGEHDDAGRRELEVLLGGALRDAGRGARAAETFLAAADGAADPMQRLDLRRRAAEQLLTAGSIERGIEVLRAVLGEIDEDLPATPSRAVAGFLWNHARIKLGGLRWKPRDASRIPPRELFRLDCYITLGLTLGMVDTMVGAMYQAKGVVFARRLGEPSRMFRILTLYTVFLLVQGRRNWRRGRRLIEECAAIAERSRDPYQLALVEGLHGFDAYVTGDHARAVAMLDAASRRLVEDTAGATHELNNLRIILGQSLRSQGDYAALSERFEQLVRDAEHRGDQYLTSTMQRSLNIHYLVQDQVAVARAALASARWSSAEKGMHLQHWYEARALSEIGLYTGELDLGDVARRTDEIVRSRLMRVVTVRTDVRWTRMRLALAFGCGNARREIAGLERERTSYTTVWAALGRAALASGADRIACLGRAAELADAHGLRSCALAARWRLGEAIGGDEGAAHIEAARDGLGALRVVRPERMVDLLAPGFGRLPARRGRR